MQSYLRRAALLRKLKRKGASVTTKTKGRNGWHRATLDTSSSQNHNTLTGGLAQYQQIFTRNHRAGKNTLDHSSLPTPLQYLTRRGLFKGRQHAEWVAICCPAHKGGEEAHPSMRVSVVDGHFKCMACGAKGGDIVELHRLVTGMGFLDAVRDLGGRFHA